MGWGAVLWQGRAALSHVPENHLLLFQQEQDLLVLLLKLLCGRLEKGSGHLTGQQEVMTETRTPPCGNARDNKEHSFPHAPFLFHSEGSIRFFICHVYLENYPGSFEANLGISDVTSVCCVQLSHRTVHCSAPALFPGSALSKGTFHACIQPSLPSPLLQRHVNLFPVPGPDTARPALFLPLCLWHVTDLHALGPPPPPDRSPHLTHFLLGDLIHSHGFSYRSRADNSKCWSLSCG